MNLTQTLHCKGNPPLVPHAGPPLGPHFSMSDSRMMRCSSASSRRRRSSASSCSRAEISMAMRSCSL
ncbi:hypothetical protein EYF80_052991 [Liparis tanakae]|uniref:Uncharacterized protein n=1 Tax=Liparis tanakae TaxID=230148 RepID=A0A4Z2F6P1_9TELE|nr:hypothetical protein EYF80_052991 [Liparis tanakae]